MNSRWLPITGLLFVATALVSMACGGSNETASGAGPGSGTLTLEQHDFFFQPTQLSAPSGQTVTVKVTNKGKTQHTFTIDALKIDQVVQPGTEQDVTLPTGTPGSFEYYCRFHHSQLSGTLTLGSGGATLSPTKTASGGGGGYGAY